MSLFPAYTSEIKDTEEECKEGTQQYSCSSEKWLENKSFVPALPAPTSSRSSELPADGSAVITLSSDESEGKSEKLRSRHKHHKKHRKHKKEKRSTRELMENDYSGKRLKLADECKPGDDQLFFIDKKKEPSFYGMKKLMGPAVPKYSRHHYRALGRPRFQYHEKVKRRRYYKLRADKSAAVVVTEEGERPEWLHDVQAELKLTTETINKTLSREPENVSAWLKLCRLQPSLLSLSPRHGPCMLSAAERRSVTEKQIAILDKALQHNPSSGELLRERYGLASTVIPGDSLSSELRSRLALQPCSVIGWLELARIERSHIASCSVPQVTSVFADAMQAVNARRRKEPTLLVENTILELALACGVFLQEAGLQEQVWTMLRLYTEPSLPPCKDPASITELQAAADQRAEALEQEAATKEDELLSSGLPSSELWLRIERLREAAHFLPAPDCSWAREGDPQRLVYPEDMAHLAQPITSPSLALRVAVTALVVLGAPPLPFTHTVASVISANLSLPHLGLLASAWPLLAADVASPAGWLGDSSLHFSSTSGSGPLTPGPGGQLYRSLLHTAFHRFAACLDQQEGVALLCWWLRVEVLFARLSPKSAPVNHVRSGAKRLLKKPENRSETQMFREFALLEAALAQSTAAAEKILVPSVQTSLSSGPIVGRADRTSLCCVYRTLAEIWATEEKWTQVSSLLCALAEENLNPISTEPPSDQHLNQALGKFEHVMRETLATQEADAEITLLEVFSEDFLVNWVMCYAWLLVASESIWSAGAMLEKTIQQLEICDPNCRGSRQREELYGGYISILEVRGRKHPGGTSLLRQILTRALNDFPDNASILAIQSNISIPIEQNPKLYKSQQLLGNIIRIIALEHRIELQEIAEKNSTDFEMTKCQPKIIAQYEKLISHYDSRHCPLIWRLYLRYVGLRATPDEIKAVFYKALEDCPWVKCLYLQGASLLPEELGNIQDLLVEKELRLHVAPEELEILRND